MLKADPTAPRLLQSGFEYLKVYQRFFSFSEPLPVFGHFQIYFFFPRIVLQLVYVDSHPSAALDAAYIDKSAQVLAQEESKSAMFWKETIFLQTSWGSSQIELPYDPELIHASAARHRVIVRTVRFMTSWSTRSYSMLDRALPLPKSLPV